MDENDPELQRKLREAERSAVPDYPDVKKGAGCGVAAAAAGAVLAWGVLSAFRKITFGERLSVIIGMALIAGLIAGGVAAFRPRS
jgi:hypothetical protein